MIEMPLCWPKKMPKKKRCERKKDAKENKNIRKKRTCKRKKKTQKKKRWPEQLFFIHYYGLLDQYMI